MLKKNKQDIIILLYLQEEHLGNADTSLNF